MDSKLMILAILNGSLNPPAVVANQAEDEAVARKPRPASEENWQSSVKPNTSLPISIRRAASAQKLRLPPFPAIPGKLTFLRSVSARKSLIATEAIRSGHRKFIPSQKSASFE